MLEIQAKDKFEILMEKFRQEGGNRDAMDNVIFVLDPKDNVAKALIAWKNTKVVVDFSKVVDIKDDWEYIWQFSRYDNEKFSLLLGLPKNDASKLVSQLKTLKLIYPDGTVNGLANQVVRAMINQSIEKYLGQGQKQKQTPPPAGNQP